MKQLSTVSLRFCQIKNVIFTSPIVSPSLAPRATHSCHGSHPPVPIPPPKPRDPDLLPDLSIRPGSRGVSLHPDGRPSPRTVISKPNVKYKGGFHYGTTWYSVFSSGVTASPTPPHPHPCEQIYKQPLFFLLKKK